MSGMGSSVPRGKGLLTDSDMRIVYDKLHDQVIFGFYNSNSAKEFAENVQRAMGRVATSMSDDGASPASSKPSDDEDSFFNPGASTSNSTQSSTGGLPVPSNSSAMGNGGLPVPSNSSAGLPRQQGGGSLPNPSNQPNPPVNSLSSQQSGNTSSFGGQTAAPLTGEVVDVRDLERKAAALGKYLVCNEEGKPVGLSEKAPIKRDYHVDDPAVQNYLNVRRQQIADVDGANTAYYQTAEDAKPASKGVKLDIVQQGLENFFNSEKLEAAKSATEKEREKKVVESNKSNWVDNQHYYRPNSYTSNGKTVDYKDRMIKVNWGEELASNRDSDPIQAFDHLRKLVTKSILEGYGSWDRIQSIAVRDNKLIINNVAFMPFIEGKYLDDGTFPWDVAGYLRVGAIAQIFDWWFLKHMNNLTILDIDDAGLFNSVIDSDLGCRGRIGTATMFKTCRRLNTLIIGGDSVTRDTLYKKESIPIKERVATSKRNLNLLQGLQMDITGATNGVQSFFVDSLKSYATNRGDRGMLRYSAGVIFRTGGVLMSGTVNLMTHLGKGIINAIRNAHSDSVNATAHDLDGA